MRNTLDVIMHRPDLRSTRATHPNWGWAFLVLVQVANSFSGAPPNITAVAIAGLALLLLPLWGAWADRNRQHVTADTGVIA